MNDYMREAFDAEFSRSLEELRAATVDSDTALVSFYYGRVSGLLTGLAYIGNVPVEVSSFWHDVTGAWRQAC